MLATRDLTVGRPGLPLLEGIGITLAPGEALLLRGANGAGKTTLLRTLAGLMPPLAGEIDVDPDTLITAGHLDAVKAALTVAENLRFWAGLYGNSLADDVVATFDLAGLENRFAGTLSAGQRRRLGLARLAVANRPLMLLDEPTVSLDAGSTARVEAWLRRRLGNGATIVAATHTGLLDGVRVLDVERHRATTLPESYL